MWPGRDPLGDARPLGSKQRRLSDPPRGGRPKGAGGCGLERLWERAEKTALRNRRCFLVLVSQSLSVCQDAMVAALSRRAAELLPAMVCIDDVSRCEDGGGLQAVTEFVLGVVCNARVLSEDDMHELRAGALHGSLQLGGSRGAETEP
mmetsp:Transcript_3535/g.8410  ORF Transcript_3535/g.8410 Transcript_3535/m.8410 type:complete len:148 (+) Transcript_3535:1284-1727(+)